jgi:hypothetical protein
MTTEHAKPNADAGANKPPAGQSKIHVDSDWKKQAQAEKERLAREVEAKGPSAAGGGARGARLPEASFSTLLRTLATQAALFMSPERDPRTGRTLQNLDLAKHHIDLLSVLEEKTKGNLTDEEKRLLDTLLYELRVAYVSSAS